MTLSLSFRPKLPLWWKQKRPFWGKIFNVANQNKLVCGHQTETLFDCHWVTGVLSHLFIQSHPSENYTISSFNLAKVPLLAMFKNVLA